MRLWVTLVAVLAIGVGGVWLASPRIAVGPTEALTAVTTRDSSSIDSAIYKMPDPEAGNRCAKWDDSPSWSVALMIRRGDRNIGWATFQTLIRQCRILGSPGRVGYEIKRFGVSSTVGRAHARIRGLTSEHQLVESVRRDARWGAEQFDDERCSDCMRAAGGPHDVGFRRVSLKGSWIIPKWDSRSVDESSTVSLERDVLPESTWSESVTLTVRGRSFRCTSNELGLLHDTLAAVCRF